MNKPTETPGACSVLVTTGTRPTLSPYDLSNRPTRSRGALVMPAVVLLAILLQTARPPADSGGVVAAPPSTATKATAVRATVPVVIDGRDDDAVWRIAPAITQFRQFQPKEDGAWDAVWDVGTQVDSLGWTAEFAIPLSQLRYVPRATNTFGFAVWRDIQRYSERVSWPVYRGSQAGVSSQLGELTGLDSLPSPRRPEC